VGQIVRLGRKAKFNFVIHQRFGAQIAELSWERDQINRLLKHNPLSDLVSKTFTPIFCVYETCWWAMHANGAYD